MVLPSDTTQTPIALTIAGSDSGGGAGIQADLKTFSALGVYGATVITALTAQNTVSVTAIEDVSPAFIGRQIDAVLSDLSVKAIKIGMLSQVEVIQAVAAGLKQYPHIPVVLDPVMVAKSGDVLLQPEAHKALVELLFPVASVITPNLPEAAILLATEEAQNESMMTDQGKALLALGCDAVLMKGGHLTGDQCVDLLLYNNEIERFEYPRIETRNTHGTGCTLSSAICAGMASGLDLKQAVSAAGSYLHTAIKASDQLTIGDGHGPVHHFHAQWSSH